MAWLQECSLYRISYCACTMALLPPTNTPFSSVLWRRLVDGMRQLFSACTDKDWIQVSVLRWRFMVIQLDWRASCRKPIGFLGFGFQSLSACHTSEAAHQSVSPATGPPVLEPMQVDSTRLSREERDRLLAAVLCSYRSFPGDLPHHTPTSCGVYHSV